MKRYGYEKKQEIIQLTAHQKKLAFNNFHYMLEALEEYVAKTGYSPNFKKQLHRKTIADSDDTVEGFEDLFLTQLFIFKAAVGKKPEYLRNEIKEEYFKWINAAGINANDCPEKLKRFLFEVNEVLEGRGDEFAELTKQKIDDGREVNPKDLLGMFGSIQQPLNRVREQRESLKGKTDKEAEVERFDASLEQGERTFNQISQGVGSTSSSGGSTTLDNHPTNLDEVVQDIKNNPKNYNVDEIPTEIDKFGRTKKKEVATYCGHARLDDYDRQGKLNFNNNPIHLWESFNARQRFEIKTAKNISSGYLVEEEIKWVVREFKNNPNVWEIKKIDGQFYLVHNSAQIKNNEIGTLIHNKEKFSNLEWTEICGALEINWGLVDNIEKNAKLEKDLVVFKQETGEYLEADDWYVHNQWGKKNEVGCLIFNSEAMIRAKDLNEREQKATSYKLEAISLQSSTSVPNTPKNDNSLGTGGIVATVAGVSILAIAGTIAIRKKLKKKKG